MAIIKRRIMTRSRILSIVFDDIRPDSQNYQLREQALKDIVAYVLANGNDVKISHNHDMGGMVVEYDDGN